ncbi:MAG: zinc-dependent dehydrogenase [Nitrososphaera sp.]
MKAILTRGRSEVDVNDVAPPRLVNPGDVVVRMRACGLCGSDLEKVYGQYGMTSARLGHEPAGEIVEVGSAVSDFAVGDRVFVHHHVACYSCHFCRHGDYTMCPKYQSSNIDPCGLAEKFLVPEWNVSRGGMIRLPASLDYDAASLVEPLACCIRALGKSSFQEGDDVAVLGCGPAGMMHVALATDLGAGNVFASDVNEFRLAFAAKSGAVALNASSADISARIKADTDGRGVDLCIVATGSTKAILQAFEITRRGGDIVLFGVPPKGSQMAIDASRLYSLEHSLIPSYAASEIETNQAIRLLENRRLNLDSLITHRFDISQGAEAVRCAHDAKDAMKVIITTK